MVVEPVFVDTNILVFATQAAQSGRSSMAHAAAKRILMEYQHRGVSLWVSRQILREYLAVVTRPQASTTSISVPQAIADVRRFAQRFELAEDGSDTTAKLLDLLERIPTAGKQVHDANIVATMLVHGIKRIVTFNIADFRRFQPLFAIEPPP
jgi:predicted nucleic acid-binding protein